MDWVNACLGGIGRRQKEDGLGEGTEETTQMTEDEETGFLYDYYGIEEILHQQDGPNIGSCFTAADLMGS